MMGSQLANKIPIHNETVLEECRTLPLSSNRLNHRKNKNSFKSPICSKRVKTKHEVTNSLKNKEKANNNTVEDREMIPRRSERRKNNDLNVQPEKTTTTDENNHSKNDAKETEISNHSQNDSFNGIPENVIKILDKELFSDEPDENLADSIKEANEVVTTKIGDNIVQQAVTFDDDKSIIKKANCDISNLSNIPKILDDIAINNENNEKETDVEEEKIEEKITKNMKNKFLNTSDDNKNYEENTDMNFVKNDGTTDDQSLDLLYVDIKRADDIINSLVKPEDEENNCSASRHNIIISNSKPNLSENDSMDVNFYRKQDKNLFDTNTTKKHNTQSENRFEVKSQNLSENCQIPSDKEAHNSFENMNCIKNKLTEEKHEIVAKNCNNTIEMKEENNEAKYNTLDNKTSNNLDASSICENTNKLKNILDKYDASVELSIKMLLQNETNVTSIQNDSSHQNNVFNNSQNSERQIQDSPIKINNNEDAVQDTKYMLENMQMKQKKLTLVCVSALDFEKENKENSLKIIEKDSKIEEEKFHSDVGDNSMDNEIFSTQNGLETTIPKQNSSEFSREVDDEQILNQQIHENIINNKTLNEKEKLKDDAQQKYVEMKNGMHDFEMSNQVINNCTVSEQHDLKNQNPIKSNLTCCKEIDKVQENFMESQFHDNTPLLQTQSDIPVYNTTAVEMVDAKSEKIEKYYKNKSIHEANSAFIVTGTEYFKMDQNKGSKQIADKIKEENMKNLEDKTLYEDVEGCFDMDDDFNLTASQINMIEINENNQHLELNESKTCTNNRNCSTTHFEQDSITVEIIDQLCYIRESVDSIKKLLNTFLMKNEDKK